MDAKIQTQTFTIARLRELALQAGGAVGPVIENEIMRLQGKLPDDYAFPSQEAIKVVANILEDFGVPMDDDGPKVMPDAPIDPTQTWISLRGNPEEDLLVFGDVAYVHAAIRGAEEQGTRWVSFRCPTHRGAIVREINPEAVDSIAPKLAAQ